MARKELRPAVAYLRTSSAANTGADKDSGKRQRATIEAFVRSAGFRRDLRGRDRRCPPL